MLGKHQQVLRREKKTMIEIWFVVSTPLKNISQLGFLFILFPVYGKIKNIPNHQPEMVFPHSILRDSC